jgi:hypothetical protein
VSPVKYELGFHIPEDGILHSHSRENFKSYIALLAGLCSGDVMCPLRSTNWGFIPQMTAFFIVTAVKTSNLRGFFRSSRKQNLMGLTR